MPGSGQGRQRNRWSRRESNKDREWEREKWTGSLPSLLLLIKIHPSQRHSAVCIWVCVCACTHMHVTEHTHACVSGVPDVNVCVRMQKWQKKNNIIGEMYAVIIGIQKMIIHIKQGAQSQPHLHVLDYMHFKSNFRRAYEWH